MAKFLFVVPPLVGHVNPTVSVGQSLINRGHEVWWVGHPKVVAPRLPEKGQLFALEENVPEDVAIAVARKAHLLGGAARLKFLWEEFFVPLAQAMRPGVDKAVDEINPDVLVVDQQALAGALVARRRKMRWATFATTSAALVDPLAEFPKVHAWREKLIDDLQRDAKLEPVSGAEYSPQLVVGFTTDALVGSEREFPQQFRFVGPSISDRPETVDFPWDELRECPRVLVSLGTVNAATGERFFSAVMHALGDEPLQVVMVAPDEFAAKAPQNFIVRSFVPQLALLEKVDAVVSHAGHNTVVEALAHGLPLVVAPIKDDQPVIAKQVVQAGAGVRLRFARAGADQIKEAVRTVLDEPKFRKAAQWVQESFRHAGGAGRAADLLEQLL